ncbi:glycoside hydrolase [Nocardiopsis gilva YIM 90087]|uniref:glucan endo-1,3-beta-D-glucosidase n=1 Tax=Nocardiopsis gilva YIM 90087 TaxID=1235441 RepID=A0A223S9Z3_9ACTN|nr:glycosyl hydrolase [Nocardiopsis gilva]ASU84923.1 glycoside hydrolase [Nocardiopsis gilva YIM 90087]
MPPAARRRRRRIPATAALLGAVLVATHAAPATSAPATADEVEIGSGSYTTALPPGESAPSDVVGAPVEPMVTEDLDQSPATNDWWSSLIFPRYPDNPYGENLFAHPLSFRPSAAGLEIGYPSDQEIVADGQKYEFGHTTDLTLGIENLASPDTRVADYGDWTVTAQWADGRRTLRTTVGQGLPFAYADLDGGAAEVTFAAEPEIWHDEGAVVGATVNGNRYALFAPSDTGWTGSETVLRTESDAPGYVSVALLMSPDDLPEFERYAYSFVTGTTVSYDYDEAGAVLTTDYRVATEAREGSQTGTLLALYPHQWKETDAELGDLRYTSPRGEMRVVAGDGFGTELTTHGLLPSMPTVDEADHDRLRRLVDEELNADDPWKGAADTYWTGKALGRLAQLVPIAEAVDHPEGRDALLDLLRGRLEDWLTATAGGGGRFYYDGTWHTLIGYPAGFGSDTELNDHDFHYGYFVQAAATVARYDPDWAADDAWGGMVKLLIRDVASPDHDDAMFPFLRSFSPYAGHGWASGHAGFASGNNKESSSEGMHFAAATALFGALTGDEELRDLGVYLHTTQASTMSRYWQNADADTFPANFEPDVAAMVWGDGGDYRIWWDGADEEHYGINYLPITASSLYLGHDPEHAGAMYASLVNRLGREPEVWRDIHWAHRALSDPEGALGAFEGQWRSYEPEAGSSKAHTYQWLTALAELGRVDTSVTADTAHYAVFENSGTRAYAAFNPGASPITVTFSDGTTLTVRPGELATG